MIAPELRRLGYFETGTKACLHPRWRLLLIQDGTHMQLIHPSTKIPPPCSTEPGVSKLVRGNGKMLGDSPVINQNLLLGRAVVLLFASSKNGKLFPPTLAPDVNFLP